MSLSNDMSDSTTQPFAHVIGDVDELRELYRPVSARAAQKDVATIDEVTRAFIAASTFCLVGTSGRDGSCEVSPKGGAPGFVKVLNDHQVVIPDFNGNNRLDSLRNIIENPHVGLLFLVPERGETLRLNGRAWVSTDPALLDLFTDEYRRPATAIAVDLDIAFMHCAKAIRRGGVWQPESWSQSEDGPSGMQLLAAHLDMPAEEVPALTDALEEVYERDLAADRPEA